MDLQDGAQGRVKVAVHWLWHVQHIHRVLPALHSIANTATSPHWKRFFWQKETFRLTPEECFMVLFTSRAAVLAACINLQMDDFGPVEKVRKFSSIQCGRHDYEL